MGHCAFRVQALLFQLLLLASGIYGFEVRYGKLSVNHTTNSKLCHHVVFPSSFQQSTGIRVQLSLAHGDKFLKVHNPAALWSTGITANGFTACLREVGMNYNDTTADIHWLALLGSHGYLEQGEASFDEFTVGTNCKSVRLTKLYPSAPRVFVSVVGPNQDPHNSALFIWTKTRSKQYSFDICLHETVVFDGAHKGIKADWFAFEDKQNPWNHTNQVTFVNKAPATSIQRDNYAICKVVNFTNPFYEAPVLSLSAFHHNNQSSSSSSATFSAISVWAEEVNVSSFRACMKSLPKDDNTAGHIIGANFILIGDLDPCIDVTCSYYAVCKAFGPRDARCVCVTKCPSYEENVCASNGTTYRNKCHFQLEMCRTRNNHTLYHPGSCRGFPWQRGSALINSSSTDQDTACTTQYFDRYTFYDDYIHVQLTVNHANTLDLNYVHDAMASWVERISQRGFDVCVATAGRRNRGRLAMANVDWFAYQGTPVGGVVDRTRVTDWWTGTKCVTINLPNGHFKSKPTILFTAEHMRIGARHDAASIWAEDITTSSFKICLRELQNFDGLHEHIYVNWLAFDVIYHPLFTEKGKMYFPNSGQPSGRFNGAFCKDMGYPNRFGHVPTIILSTNHKSSSGSVSPTCNAVSTWVEYKNTTGFRVCLKELYVDKYEPLTVTYLLLFDVCSRGWQYFQGVCYQTSQSCRKWTAAENMCRPGSAHLVTVRNQEENVFVQQRIGGEKSWIGLNDKSIEGDFRWSSKMRVNWTYWEPKQPNDYESTQDCVHTLGPVYHFRWNDVDCATCNNYTCAKDYDECSGGSHGCHVNATCTNIYGSYTCQCNVGFTGDGRNCTDVDECNVICRLDATCINTIGSYSCKCNAGYSLNGHVCTDIDECTANSHSCHVNATCTNTKGNYTCTCNSGYRGDGYKCVLGRGFITGSSILKGHMNYINKLNSYLASVIQSNSRSVWVRCWRAASDGWSAHAFHSRCDFKGPTVTIVYASGYYFGGYTDVPWFYNYLYRRSTRSFLFSLYNQNGFSPVKLPIVKNYDYAIYGGAPYGPMFGRSPHDLFIASYASSNSKSYQYRSCSYKDPGFYFTGSQHFTPSDIEVFYETT